MSPSKTCFRCDVTKPLTEFYVHPRMADGHLNKCKNCTKMDTRRHYRKDLALSRAKEVLRSSSAARRAARSVWRAAYRKRHPGRDNARNAVARAIRAGRLSRRPCEVCGVMNVEAHHADYSKPLDVRWLCRIHHREVEGRLAVVVSQ